MSGEDDIEHDTDETGAAELTQDLAEANIPSATSLVAIVGRPNVGKSTLFNRLLGARKAIVEDRPGVTRDRLYGAVNHEGRSYLIVDTGGLDLDDDEGLMRHIRTQAEIAIAEASSWIAVRTTSITLRSCPR